jgi:hypothetical protein
MTNFDKGHNKMLYSSPIHLTEKFDSTDLYNFLQDLQREVEWSADIADDFGTAAVNIEIAEKIGEVVALIAKHKGME